MEAGRLQEGVNPAAMVWTRSYPPVLLPPHPIFFLGLELAKSLAKVRGNPLWVRRLKSHFTAELSQSLCPRWIQHMLFSAVAAVGGGEERIGPYKLALN